METREKTNPRRAKANRVMRIENGKPKEKFTDDPGGAGREIVREQTVCPTCAQRLLN